MKRKEAVITVKPMIHTRSLRDAVKRDIQRSGNSCSKGKKWSDMDGIYLLYYTKVGLKCLPRFL